MTIEKSNRRLLIFLITFVLIITSIVTGVLINVITSAGINQFNQAAVSSFQLLQERIDRTAPELSDLDERSTFIDQIFNLNIRRLLVNITNEKNRGWIYSYTDEKKIDYTFPETDTSLETISRTCLELIHNNPDSVEIHGPYRNHSGQRVMGASVWLEKLNRGIILEQPAGNILSPWYYLTALVLTIMLSSFLIFFLFLIILNKKRMEAFDHNPLTHLPGNRKIMDKLQAALLSDDDLMVIYCDLDNFKAYNDLYGFSAGDDVIVFSARILLKYFKPSRNLFTGHIGGDDFIVIGPTGTLKSNASLFGNAFDREILNYYTEQDREQGYITSKNRQGEVQTFPFIAMSMGGIELKRWSDIHPLRVTEICAEIKKVAKKRSGSILVIDQRSPEN